VLDVGSGFTPLLEPVEWTMMEFDTLDPLFSRRGFDGAGSNPDSPCL